ncbi:MAG: DUF167 domain-containing protein [Phyllobacteriaceae bacterium]|nr:DUF167 domain-containing protein [Phyllobacteriaceae bacterium]
MSNAAPAPAIQIRPDGVRLRVRVTPKSRRDEIGPFERLADGNEVLIVRVRAAPAEGEANAAVIALLAAGLGLSRSRIAVVSGPTARVKTLHLQGDADAIVAALPAGVDPAASATSASRSPA